MESASRLQNETSKTNTGLKLDFPKHCIPSHFTHHHGLRTRIDLGRKIRRRFGVGELAGTLRGKKTKKNALHRRLMKSDGRNLFICGMLRNCPAYVDFPSLRTEFQLLKNFFFFSLALLLLSCQINLSFLPPSSPELPLIPRMAPAFPLLRLVHFTPSEGEAGNRGSSGTLLAGESGTLNSLAEVKLESQRCLRLVRTKSQE